jgi:hypothetical protein
MNAPPYPAPYWETLTPRQQLNDLVHKIAQRYHRAYPEAYRIASTVIDTTGPEPYAVRLGKAGLLETAINALIEYHRKATP